MSGFLEETTKSLKAKAPGNFRGHVSPQHAPRPNTGPSQSATAGVGPSTGELHHEDYTQDQINEYRAHQRAEKEKRALALGNQYSSKEEWQQAVGPHLLAKHTAEAKAFGDVSESAEAVRAAGAKITENLSGNASATAVGLSSQVATGVNVTSAARHTGVVMQAGAELYEQANNAARQKKYEGLKQVHNQLSNTRRSAVQELHDLNLPQGESDADRAALDAETKQRRSKVTRDAWKALVPNLAHGLKTAAYAKETGNESDLTPEMQEHETVGVRNAKLNPGDTVSEEHIEKGTTKGWLNRTLAGKSGTKLSSDRKLQEADLKSKIDALETKKKQELEDRSKAQDGKVINNPSVLIGRSGYNFRGELTSTTKHTKIVADLNKKAADSQKIHGKTLFSSAKFVGNEATEHAGAKTGFEALAQPALDQWRTSRDHHANKMSEMKASVGKNSFGFTNSFSPEDQKKFDHHQSISERLDKRIAQPTADDLRGFVSPEDHAAAAAHYSKMKDLESVRDTGLTVAEHKTREASTSELAAIEKRKTSGLSTQDLAKLAQHKADLKKIPEEQRQENKTLRANIGHEVRGDGYIGGLAQPENQSLDSHHTTIGQHIGSALHGLGSGLDTASQVVGAGAGDAERAHHDGNKKLAIAISTSYAAQQVASATGNAVGLGGLTGGAVQGSTALVANAGKGIAAGTKALTKDAWQAKQENENARGFLSGERLASNPVLNLGERGKVENESGLPEMLHTGLKAAYAGVMQNGGSEPAQALLHQQQHAANASATEHINSALEQVSSRSAKSDHSSHSDETASASAHSNEPVMTAHTDDATTPHSEEPTTAVHAEESGSSVHTEEPAADEAVHSGELATTAHSEEPTTAVHAEEPASEPTHLDKLLGEHRDDAEAAVLDYQDEKIDSLVNPEEPELHERPQGQKVEEPSTTAVLAPRAKFTPTPKKLKTPSVDPDHASMNKLFGEKKQKSAPGGPDHDSMNALFREHPGFTAAKPAGEPNFQKLLDPIANSGTRKGLGWFRKLKGAAGRAMKAIPRGFASLKQRFGLGLGPVDHDQNTPHIGELSRRFDEGSHS